LHVAASRDTESSSDPAGAQAPVLVLRNGRVLTDVLREPKALDIVIGADGQIAQLVKAAPAMVGVREVDLADKLVVPGLVDVHQHLDKTRTLRLVDNPAGTLDGAIQAYSRMAAHVNLEDLNKRAERTLTECLARGTVAIRTHVNIDPVIGVRGIKAMTALRERARDRIRLQIVGFVTGKATNMPAQASTWLGEAVASGIDVIGGAPALADAPEPFLDLLFEQAAASGLRIDLHLDEHLDSSRQLFDHVIDRTIDHGLQGRVVAGHCSVLGAMPAAEANRIADRLAEAQIGVITLPAANLFLQGRSDETLRPRGLTRVADLIAAGVAVAAASDNIQDPFVPVGGGDMLEVARWTMLAGQLDPNDLVTIFGMVSSTPAGFMGFGENYGLREGARADLLVSSADDLFDLVATGPLDRAVLFDGRVVAGTL